MAANRTARMLQRTVTRLPGVFAAVLRILQGTVSRRPGVFAAALLVFLAVSTSHARELDEAEKAAIQARLGQVRPASTKLVLAAGDTVLIEERVRVDSRDLKGPDTDYDGIISDIGAVPGLSIHRRTEGLSFVRRGTKTEVRFRYAVLVEPNARRGGRIRARFELRRRKGLGSTVATKSIRHQIRVRPPSPTTRDLVADFLGYRYYLPRATKRMRVLRRAGLRRLDIQDDGPITGTDKLSSRGVDQLRAFEAERRRTWVAHRHLRAASESAVDPEIQAQARALLSQLGRADENLTGLPPLVLVDRPSAEPEAPPAEANPDLSEETSGGTLAPVAEYPTGSEGTVAEAGAEPTPARAEPEPEPHPEPVQPTAEPEAPLSLGLGDPATDPRLLAVSEGLELVPSDPGDRERLAARYYLPTYARALTLDDVNIAYGGAIRASFAEVQRPEDASTLAVFYTLQVAITDAIGFELTLPTQLVSLDVGTGNQTLYRTGNPLIAGKYRFHLPTVLGRKPSLSVRARWGMAISQRNNIPASDNLFTEQFSSVPNIVDTYAFLLEKTDIGVGTSVAWQYQWVLFSAQFYLDYLFPTEIATDQLDFLALGYGASVGFFPLGEIVGGYLETRGVSFVAGPQRTEVFAYAGFRGLLFDYFEPAVWVGLPLGSVGSISTVQVGMELRFSYDIRSIIQFGRRRDAPTAESLP